MKDLILEVANTMPENVTIDDFLEALFLRIKIDKALDDVENNRVYTSEELKKELL
jgi:hypothetical protein